MTQIWTEFSENSYGFLAIQLYSLMVYLWVISFYPQVAVTPHILHHFCVFLMLIWPWKLVRFQPTLLHCCGDKKWPKLFTNLRRGSDVKGWSESSTNFQCSYDTLYWYVWVIVALSATSEWRGRFSEISDPSAMLQTRVLVKNVNKFWTPQRRHIIVKNLDQFAKSQ